MPDRTCSVYGCERPVMVKSRELCQLHYHRWWRYGDTSDRPGRPTECSVDGCGKRVAGRGWCSTHYGRWWRTGTIEAPLFRRICGVEGCEKPHQCHGRCATHNWRWKTYGVLDNPRPYANAPDGMKWCPHCSTYKPFNEFHAGKQRFALQPMCKVCSLVVSRATPNYRINGAAKSRRRRAVKRERQSEPYTSVEIADRDGWVCQICRKRIGRKLVWPHLRSLSIDHIVPLDKGGDDMRINVQAAHLGCNLSKHTGGIDQLRLIG